MTSTRTEAAAAVSIGAGLALRKRDELLGLLQPCFARTEPWLQAGKYASVLASELPRVNGWSIARRGGDRTPDRTQRLLNHAIWDTFAAMGVVRRFAVAGLEDAARRGKRRGALVVGAIDETGQEKAGEATCGAKLREHFEAQGQAYVLRVPSNFTLTLAAGTKLTCAEAVTALLKHKRRWEVRSAGHGSKGQRWYAWAWLATASPRHHLLISARSWTRTGSAG